MRRPPGEYIVLASLVGSLAYCGYQALTGELRLEGGLVAITLITAGIAIGSIAVVLLALRHPTGALVGAVFYGLQTLKVTLPSGAKWYFNSLPAFYYRVAGDKEFPISLNIIAVVLCGFCILLWQSYRTASARSLAAPPNTSFERTRGE
jgi:hypothetical protein